MSQTLYEVLKALPKAIRGASVFTNPDTGMPYDRFNNTTWKRVLSKKAGISSFRWHDLRHTFGSRLAQAGVSLIAIKELMGHSDIRVTLRYAHLMQSNLKDAIRALDGEKDTSFTTHGATHRPIDKKEAVG